MAVNPNPARITDASWWLMQELLALQPGTRNGGLYANKSGYHNTRAANDAHWPGNYSVRDVVDRQGPADKCAAYDWTFPDAQAGAYRTIEKYTDRLLASAQDLDDPRLNGWREFYGQADADTVVEGWDTRYGRPATSDPSHLWHLHFSESRAFVADMDNKRALLSVLKGESTEEWRNGGGTAVALTDADAQKVAKFVWNYMFDSPWVGEMEPRKALHWMKDARFFGLQGTARLAELSGQLAGQAILIEKLAAAQASPLTPDELAVLRQTVADASREGAGEVLRRLAAAGDALDGDPDA